jgi:hypothetical protein
LHRPRACLGQDTQGANALAKSSIGQAIRPKGIDRGPSSINLVDYEHTDLRSIAFLIAALCVCLAQWIMRD